MERRPLRESTLRALLAFGLLGTSGVGAQDAPAAPPPSTPTFLDRVEVRVIEVDVVVQDAKGDPVTGLTRDDFELLEDGKPVEISNFLAYTESAGTGPAAPGAPGTPGAPAAPTGEAIEPAEPPAPPANWVVYVDQSRLDPGPRNEALKELRDFMNRALRPQDRALLAEFDGQSLQLSSPLDIGSGSAVAALDALAKKRGFVSGLAAQRTMLEREIAGTDTSDQRTAAFNAERLLGQIDALAEAEVVEAKANVNALSDLLSILGGVQGRVAILLVGSGIDDQPGERLYRVWRQKFVGVPGVAESGNRELDERGRAVARAYGELLRTVNSGRFTLYSIQAGAGRGPSVSADMPGDIGMNATSPAADVTGLRLGSSLSGLARETGGRPFVSAGDLEQRLESARRDLVTYYSLGYSPLDDSPGKRRPVEVRVKRDGVRVLHRAAVSTKSWEDQAAEAAISALVGGTEPENPFGVVIEVLPPAEGGKKRGAQQVPINVRVPMSAVTLIPDAAVHRGKLLFQFALFNADGGYRRLEGRPLDFEVPNGKLTGALTQHLSFRIDLKLEPGSYKVAAAVLDQVAGARSVATAPIEVVKP